MSEIKPYSDVDGRKKLAVVVPLNTPFTLQVFPSQACNFKCKYCFQSLGQKFLEEKYGFRPELMPFETLEKAVEQSLEFDRPYKMVSFTGTGEPLCNKNLPQMVRAVKQAGIGERIDLVTNAALLNESLSEQLVDAGLDVMRVSLQGITDESYYNTCGAKVSFDKLYYNLKYFYEIKGNAKLYVKTMDTTLDFGKGEDKKFFELFDKCSDRMHIDKVCAIFNDVKYSEAESQSETDRYGIKHNRRYVCAMPFYMLNLRTDEDVMPCALYYKKFVLGNVYKTTLKSMWQSEELKNFQKRQLNYKQCGQLEDCASCGYSDSCQHPEDTLDGYEDEILERLSK